MRNMFVTFMMLLSNDPYSGAWSIDSSAKLRQLCHDQGMYFWKECRQLIDSMSKVLNQGRLCDGRHPNFKVTMKPFYNLNFAQNFYKLINSLLGRRGALVVVSVGFHMECNVENTIDGYLGPVVDLIERNQPQNDSWPKLIFVLPMLTGLLKPPAYFRFQNDDKINAFSSRMTNYCNHHRIPVLDFRQLSKYIHSFDGTHYGL
uniref:Uncharacterized protein n=1 Tax=Ciona savignyi TaxID=51511 RepID=H2YPA2_CIOSA